MQKPQEEKKVTWTDQELKDFEKELNGRNFEQWAIDDRLYIVNERYPNGAVSYERSQDYCWAGKKMNALEGLRARRKYAQKQEETEKQELLKQMSWERSNEEFMGK